MQAIATITIGRQRINAFHLDDLDIKVSASADGQQEIVTIRQQRWVDVHKRLRKVLGFIQKGKIGDAKDELNKIKKIYAVKNLIVLNEYREINDSIDKIQLLARGLKERQVPDGELLAAITRSIEETIHKIRYPNERIWVDVPITGVPKAVRSLGHSIESYARETGTIEQKKAFLEHYTRQLGARDVSSHVKEQVRIGLMGIKEWLEHPGVSVDPKIAARIKLAPAIEMIDRDAFAASIVEINNAIKDLDDRLKEIKRIVPYQKRKIASMINKYGVTIEPNSNDAMITPEDFKKGGIDLTPANMNVQTKNGGETIKFHIDPVMLAQLQNTSGFVPVIINIQPLKDLSNFLGIYAHV